MTLLFGVKVKKSNNPIMISLSLSVDEDGTHHGQNVNV